MWGGGTVGTTAAGEKEATECVQLSLEALVDQLIVVAPAGVTGPRYDEPKSSRGVPM